MSDNGEVKRIRPDGSVIRPDARVVAEQQAAFNAAPREVDATMGLSPSVYGQAARESAIRAKLGDLPAAWDAIGGVVTGRLPPKMLTPKDVLTILRGVKTQWDVSRAPESSTDALRDAIATFEWME